MIYNYIDKNMTQWAHDAVRWCVDKGIIKGTNDKGDLGLNNTRLWTCMVVYRLGKLLGGICLSENSQLMKIRILRQKTPQHGFTYCGVLELFRT